MKPTALVLGLGGIGTITALSLETNDQLEVSVIVRKQDDEFLTHGIEIDSIAFGRTFYKPKNVYKSLEECKHIHFDYVVVCTKNLPDSSMPCVKLIEPVVKPNTTIILIQNGLNIELPVLAKFPQNLVIGGISLTGSSKYGNMVKHIGKDDMALGIFKANNVPKEQSVPILQVFVDAYKRDDNKITIDETPELSRWYKLCYNSVYNSVTAIVDMDLTRCHIAGGNSIFYKLVQEIVQIADSEGYKLDPKTVDYIFHKSDGLFYPPSMLLDTRKNQLMEIEVIVGAPLRVAQENGVEAPNLNLVYELLKMKQFSIMEKQGLFEIDEEKYRNVSSDEAPGVFDETKRVQG